MSSMRQALVRLTPEAERIGHRPLVCAIADFNGVREKTTFYYIVSYLSSVRRANRRRWDPLGGSLNVRRGIDILSRMTRDGEQAERPLPPRSWTKPKTRELDDELVS